MRRTPNAAIPIAILSGLLYTGCPPTLSQQRGEAHLDAWAEAERHVHHGRLDEAEAAYAEAAEHAERRIDRDEADYRRSRVLIDQDRHAEAVTLLDEIAAREPVSRRTGRAVYDAARIRLEVLGETDAAMEGFERVIREFPDDGLGTRALFHRLGEFRPASVASDEGSDASAESAPDPEPVEGAEEAEEAEEPTSPPIDAAGATAFLDELYPDVAETSLGDDVLKAKADIQLEAGDRAGARETFERIVRDHPYPQGHRWDDAIWALAEMDVEDGHPHVAIARLERMIERHDNTTIIGSYTQSTMPLAVLTMARIYRDEVGDYDAADRQFRRLPRRFPRSLLRDDAAYERGVMWLEQGERDRGCDILRDVVEDYEVGHARREAERRVEADCAQ